MSTTDDTIEVRTPCCGRKMTGAPLMHHATTQLTRTCPKCRTKWTVLIEPLPGAFPEGMDVHSLTWTPVPARCTCFCETCWEFRANCQCPDGPTGIASSTCPVDGWSVED